MKKILSFFNLLFCLSLFVNGQAYSPVQVSGFNADVIYDQGEEFGATQCMDEIGWAYYSVSIRADGSLPAELTTISGVDYKLASFKGNNALLLNNKGMSRTLILDTPVKTNELWILGLGTHGDKNIKVVLNYEDGSKSEEKTLTYPDWYRDSSDGAGVFGLKRIRVSGDGIGNVDDRANFCLFDHFVPADDSRNIVSVSFTLESDPFAVIFAVSALDENAERPRNNLLYFIPNSHLDTQWNWTVKTTIDEYLPNTLRGNFALFEKYPDYIFNFEGAIKYMFAKEYYPEEYEKLKEYVAKGNWNISGGSVDANDVMVPSAESIIRNFLYGQEFYKKEFGRKGGNDIMLPDCFGFPYSLPTLGAHCGVVGFHSQKLSWGSAYDINSLPNFGLWRGVDGSEIYAVHKPKPYGMPPPCMTTNMAYDSEVLTEILSNKNTMGISKAFRYVGNDGDRGGCVDDESAEYIHLSMTSEGPVTVKVTTPDDFFSSITPEERAGMSVWDNELPMRTHGVGCYTSQTILKYWNRKNELLADAVEKTSVLADWLGGLPYQSDIIRDSWIRLLWHQFHDDLTGTSIPQAYTYTYNDHVLVQLDLSKTLTNAVGAVTRQMNTQVEGIPVVVSNPLSIEREDIVEAVVQIDEEPADISVYDPEGNAVLTQKLGFENGTLKFLFATKVPSLGYAVYELRLNDDASKKIASTLAVSDKQIENDEYKVLVNNNGDVYSVYDKKLNKELLKSPIRLAMLYDRPDNWPSWEISRDNVYRDPTAYVDENVNVTIAENGPLRASLKITRSKNGSDFVQYVRLSSYGIADRIDFVNEVNWQTKETLLKAVFPLTASNPEATFDISIGTIKRPNRNDGLYEVSGHQWADITHNDNSYGISILNDCKYGWDKPDDNTLRLSLIHTPKVEGDYGYQRNQDLGLNKFTYSLYRHTGQWNESTQWSASALNQPLIAHQAQKHAGTLGKSYEYVNVNNKKVAVKALKKAEASDDMIVRVYELTGYAQGNVEISFPAEIISAKEVNGIEEEIGDVNYSGNKIRFNLTRHQPKTFSVKLAKPESTSNAPADIAIDLSGIYNVDVMSYDSNKKDGEFGEYYAYPAELIPDALVSDGVDFAMGSRADGEMNAIRCEGQQITLPAGHGASKLYVLAASRNSAGSMVGFQIDGQAVSVNVEYFADYVGQWGTVYGSRHYRPENVALTLTHRHDVSADRNMAYHYLYMYKYMIPVSADANALTLPDDNDVVVFAISLSDNSNDDVVPVSSILNLSTFEDIENAEEDTDFCGTQLMPVNITASGYVNEQENPSKATDNNALTKWCDNKSATKWIEYDFGGEVEICQWSVLHAGIENDNLIAADFRLQYYNENNGLLNADIVTGNTNNKTNRRITPIRTAKVRLTLDKEEQGNGAARVYSFNVYGDNNSTRLNELEIPEYASFCTPNPFSSHTLINWFVPAGANNMTLSIYNLSGTLVDTMLVPVSEGGKQEFTWQNNSQPAGIYFYSLTANDENKIISKSNGKMIIIY